ncbi:MAG: hypothetical protein EBV03_04635, partial [Proteobacteria bacterium]|nr:hypothetical protein [Pseudomonadota bacterium]
DAVRAASKILAEQGVTEASLAAARKAADPLEKARAQGEPDAFRREDVGSLTYINSKDEYQMPQGEIDAGVRISQHGPLSEGFNGTLPADHHNSKGYYADKFDGVVGATYTIVTDRPVYADLAAATTFVIDPKNSERTLDVMRSDGSKGEMNLVVSAEAFSKMKEVKTGLKFEGYPGSYTEITMADGKKLQTQSNTSFLLDDGNGGYRKLTAAQMAEAMPKSPKARAVPTPEVKEEKPLTILPADAGDAVAKAAAALKKAGAGAAKKAAEKAKPKTVMQRMDDLGTTDFKVDITGTYKENGNGSKISAVDVRGIASGGVQVSGFENTGLASSDTYTIQANGPVYAYAEDVVKGANRGNNRTIETGDQPLVLVFTREELDKVQVQKVKYQGFDGDYTRITMPDGTIIDSKSKVEMALTEQNPETKGWRIVKKVEADAVVKAQNEDSTRQASAAVSGTRGVTGGMNTGMPQGRQTVGVVTPGSTDLSVN